MTNSFNPADDLFRTADGLETVTLYRGGQPATGVTLSCALRRAVSLREAAASDGRYTASDATWHLSAMELPDTPRLGDVLVDAQTARWTILEVRRTTLGSRWRCMARSLAVVYGLDDAVTLLRPSYVKSPVGAAESVWQVWETGVRARIEPLTASTAVEHQARPSQRRFRVFVEETAPLDPAHRIQGPDGAIYKILSVAGAEQLGQLQSAEVELTPWP